MYPYNVIPSWLNPNGAGTDQEPYQTYSGLSIPMDIQPESPELTALSEGEVFSTFHFFTSYSGIKPGWRLTVTTPGNYYGNTYEVRGVEAYPNGAGYHWEGTLGKASQP